MGARLGDRGCRDGAATSITWAAIFLTSSLSPSGLGLCSWINSLTLFIALGVEVKKIDQGYRYPGTHIVNIDGRNLPTGIYFYQLRAGNFVKTQKMSLIK